MTTPTAPRIVGMMQPSFLHGGPAVRATVIDRVRKQFPDIEILDAEYAESSDLRTRRGSADYVRRPDDATPLTDEQAAVLSRVEAVIALDLPFDIARHAPRLRWVQATGSGIGQFRSAGLAEAGIALTNAAGTSSDEIAEFVLARILQHLKRLPEIDAEHDAVNWRPIYGRPVAGTTIGLVGLGAIGLRTAELARTLGMRVLGCRRTPADPPPSIERILPVEELAAMVAECDVVVVSLPETKQTRGLFDHEIFEAMAPHAFLCNVGRGSSIVEGDLIEALRSGQIAAAALDVFDEEPLPSDSPLWTTPGIRVSAHCSSVPSVAVDRVVDLFCDNLKRLRKGEPLRNLVDLDLGY